MLRAGGKQIGMLCTVPHTLQGLIINTIWWWNLSAFSFQWDSVNCFLLKQKWAEYQMELPSLLPTQETVITDLVGMPPGSSQTGRVWAGAVTPSLITSLYSWKQWRGVVWVLLLFSSLTGVPWIINVSDFNCKPDLRSKFNLSYLCVTYMCIYVYNSILMLNSARLFLWQDSFLGVGMVLENGCGDKTEGGDHEDILIRNRMLLLGSQRGTC